MSYRKIQEHDIPVIKVSEEGKSKIAAEMTKILSNHKTTEPRSKSTSAE